MAGGVGHEFPAPPVEPFDTKTNVFTGFQANSDSRNPVRLPGIHRETCTFRASNFARPQRDTLAGYRSLRGAGDNLLSLHRLNVPNTLHRSLLSTNAIENSFLNTRRKLGRTTRFRDESNQASRCLSQALLEAEKGIRRISGQSSLAALTAALTRPRPTPE